ADVPLAKRVVRYPAAGEVVQIELLGLFLAVAAALPRKHRAPQPGGRRGVASFAQAPVSIHQQGAGDLGRAKVEKREDEQFVPEYVTLIRLAGPAARRHADVQADRLR